METPPLPDDDALDHLLAGSPTPSDSDRLRTAIFARTAQLLRRRRWRNRLTTAAATAACFALGLGALWLATARNQPDEKAEMSRPAEQPLPRAAGEEATSLAEAPPQVLEYGGPLARADKRADVFRLAGDRYLTESNDVESALRCYRQALDLGGDDATEILPDDTWLLMALKDARKKEKRDATNDG